MDHLQPEMFLKRFKIAVVVQKRVLPFNAKSRDHAINCFAHGVTAQTKITIVSGGDDSQLFPARVEDPQLTELEPGSLELRLGPDALKNLAEYHICQPDPASA